MSDDGEKLPKTKNRISAPYSLLPNPDSLIPKIADFGLAKQLEGQTESAAIAKGTPSYMAPEQETNKDISPRTDVYALGAILYEMLTGRPPFVGATAVEILRQVREQEPAPPRRLQANVPRDLETICLKCLNKAPEKRYASAQELALDLQRFQRGEPIVARPVSAIERSFRWMKRHPAYSGLIGVVGIASVLLLSSWAYFTIEIQKERDDAVTQKGIADVAKQKALAQKKIADDQKANAIAKQKLAEKRLKLVVNSIESLLIDTSQKALLDVANAEPVRRKLLERARRYYQNLLADEKDDPKLLYELAGTYFRVARMRQDDSATEARQLYQTTSRILEYLVDRYPLAQPKNPYIRFHIDLATTYENLAIQELNLGNFTDGVSYHQKALAKRQAIVKSESIKENDLVQVQNRLNMSYLNLGLAYEMRGRFKQSLVWIEKSKAAQQDLIRDHPNNFLLSRLRYNLGDVYLALARIHNRQGDLQQAVALGRKSCETADAVLDMNLRLANIPLSRVEELRTRAYLLTAEIVLGQEKVKTARAYLNQIESLCRNLAKKSGDNPYRDSLLAKWHLLDGEFKRQNNSLAEAETAFAKSQAIMESVVRREGLAQYFLELGNIDIQLGKTHEQQGNMAKAVQNYKTGMDRLQNGAKAYPNNAILQAEATKHCNWLAVKAKALANDEKISLAQELASHLSTSNKLSGEALFALAWAFGKVSIVISKDQNRTEADRTTLCELAEALAAKLLLRAEKTGFLDQETQSAKTLFEAPELTRLLNRDDLKGLTNRLSTGR